MARKICFVLLFFSGCVYSPPRTPPPLKSQRDPAFFNLFSVSRLSLPPAPALENPAPPQPAPPSSLPETDRREMALFYDRWAFQFRRAVRNYQSAVKEYKQAVRHFKKMSEHTKKKTGSFVFKAFPNSGEKLKGRGRVS